VRGQRINVPVMTQPNSHIKLNKILSKDGIPTPCVHYKDDPVDAVYGNTGYAFLIII